MTQVFDPEKAVHFDLDRGRVRLRGTSYRVVVPAEALAAVCSAAGTEATRAFGRSVGDAIGRAVASRAAEEGSEGRDAVRAASIGTIVEMLGGEVALVGLGNISLERWGRALVLVLADSPLQAAGDMFFEAVAASAIAAATGQDVATVLLERNGPRARFLLCDPLVAERTQEWMKGGLSWGEAVVRLHRPGGESA